MKQNKETKNNIRLVCENSSKSITKAKSSSIAIKAKTEIAKISSDSIFIRKKLFSDETLNTTANLLFATLDDAAIENQEGRRIWRARDLQNILGYERWFNFERIVKRAIMYFTKSGQSALSNITPYSRKITFSNNFTRNSRDYYFSIEALHVVSLLAEQERFGIFFIEIYSAQIEVQDLISGRKLSDSYIKTLLKNYFLNQKNKINETISSTSNEEKSLIQEIYKNNKDLSKKKTSASKKIDLATQQVFESSTLAKLDNSELQKIKNLVKICNMEIERLERSASKAKNQSKKKNDKLAVIQRFQPKSGNILDIGIFSSYLKY